MTKVNASFFLATVNNAQLQQLSIANYSEKVVAVTEIVQLPVNSSNYDWVPLIRVRGLCWRSRWRFRSSSCSRCRRSSAEPARCARRRLRRMTATSRPDGRQTLPLHWAWPGEVVYGSWGRAVTVRRNTGCSKGRQRLGSRYYIYHIRSDKIYDYLTNHTNYAYRMVISVYEVQFNQDVH